MGAPRRPALHPLVTAVRDFVDTEVRPVAMGLEHDDRYPQELVERMRALGLFGALVPRAHGGLGLDVATYAAVIEELCRGWMSLAGVINSHTMAALIVLHHGTDEQRGRLLPRFARGEARGGLCLTEPHAGSDVQAIRTVALRQGDRYLVTGTKMFVTNGREGNTFALLALTDAAAQPRHRGMSCFIVEKGAPGLSVVKSIAKLGYKGVDTAELLFDEFPVPAANLVGGVEGRGFAHVMSGLETGRINIAARAVGVAQAAWDAARVRARAAPVGAPALRLADMAARVTAARLLTRWSAAMKDRGERCDVEAGMAKLYASEAAQRVAADALRVHGEEGALAALPVERHYRDTPLMIIGEGTNEIQRTIIARGLLRRHGERAGALVSLEAEPEERRQVVLAVRQLVEKHVAPSAAEHAAYPAEIVDRLADLGVLGALAPADAGGIDVDVATFTMIVEELARGSGAVAAIVATHAAASWAIARHGTARQRETLLAPMTQGRFLATVAFDPALEHGGAAGAAAAITARAVDEGWRLTGRAALVENAARATHLLVVARHEAVAVPGAESGVAPAVSCFVVDRATPGLTVGAPRPSMGQRGLDVCDVGLDGVACGRGSRLGDDGRGTPPLAEAAAVARLAVAATAVGLAQAAFEAALRYSQQRTTFGKPICEHQAVQLKLADMASGIAAARLLTLEAAERLAADGDLTTARLARIHASEMAAEATLEAMRIHGGYGYTAEFPVERYYRDAVRLGLVLGGNDGDRVAFAAVLSDDPGV